MNVAEPERRSRWRNRRWFQFSLATLLLVMGAVALGLGLWSDSARKQQRAVAAIQRLGGSCGYRYQSRPGRSQKPPGPAWLRNLLGIDYLDRVDGVRLVGDSILDADLALLQGLPGLEHLRLGGERLTDAGLAYLEGSRRLIYLSLECPGITDAGLAHLAGLQCLDSLHLECPQVTDAGLAHLKGLRLGFLDLRSARVTDAGLAHIGEIHRLTRLELHCSIGDAGMEHLKGLYNLTSLKSLGLPADRGAKRKVMDSLSMPTRMDFVDAPLPDVCKYLQDFHAVRLQIDGAALEEAGIDRSVPVTYTSRKLPKGGNLCLDFQLSSMLEPLGLDWHVGRECLVITTEAVVAKRHARLILLRQAVPSLHEVRVDW